ncbi:hypothetical protein V6582_14805 [Agrobacterium vitis]|uniref:hypothetical protein n=1 Tax=Agrobacterium vitis TaxID=373 RepID=UPI0030E458AE
MKFVFALPFMVTFIVQPAIAANELQQWQSRALKAIKQEKKVIDAKWRSAEDNVIWLSMQSDGSPRDGFAQYVCILLKHSGVSGRHTQKRLDL